ncbi:MAG: GNAT family N-acetyltransferase [Bryobacteraceae bacterium]|nr:GNAT family N-acetyltransferase [Solibacteraceae bacterium]MCO5349612.1 GNAT family N-acetyltransferase [Bryobacteraceae bacterium]
MSFTFRPLTEEDLEAGLALSEGAGWNQLRRDWRVFLERNPEGSVAAEREGQVVGTAATLDYGPFAWISMVLVDPAQRGQGLGTALLERTIEILKESPCARLDATPLGEPVYRKLGFVDEYPLERWERAAGLAPAVAGVAALSSVEEVAALDAAVFGADRRWLLDWLLAGARHLAWRCGDGFLLGREGRRFTQLGPLVCANDDEAVALIHAGLAASGRGAVIDVPAGKGGVVASLGFVKQRTLLRMRRGAAAPVLDPRLFAIAGPELG